MRARGDQPGRLAQGGAARRIPVHRYQTDELGRRVELPIRRDPILQLRGERAETGRVSEAQVAMAGELPERGQAAEVIAQVACGQPWIGMPVVHDHEYQLASRRGAGIRAGSRVDSAGGRVENQIRGAGGWSTGGSRGIATGGSGRLYPWPQPGQLVG